MTILKLKKDSTPKHLEFRSIKILEIFDKNILIQTEHGLEIIDFSDLKKSLNDYEAV